MIKLHNVGCHYDKKIILKEVSFFLQNREHLTILGSNGSGKSTLAKALSGLIPYEGSIKIEDQELQGISHLQRAKELVYIPSKLESFERYTTVEDFVLMGRFPHKEPYKDYAVEDKILVQDALKYLDIQTLSKNRLHDLSSGQQQLTLIAQALVQESKLLIFDEPTANLDPKNTLFFANELKKLQQTHTIILITHDLSLASFMQNQVLFISEQKATLYKSETFFQAEQLSALYGITFEIHGKQIGVAYE